METSPFQAEMVKNMPVISKLASHPQLDANAQWGLRKHKSDDARASVSLGPSTHHPHPPPQTPCCPPQCHQQYETGIGAKIFFSCVTLLKLEDYLLQL